MIFKLTWHEIMLVIGYALVLIVGAIMNLVSFVYFGFHKRCRRSTYRSFITHLSLADFFCCTILPVFSISGIINNEKWLFGRVTCYYVMPFGKLSGLLSAWILCGMTYERYIALSRPLVAFSRRKIHYFLVMVWMASLGFMFLYHWNMRLEDDRCYHSSSRTFAFISIMTICFEIVIPSVILVIFYVCLQRFLSRNRAFRASQFQVTIENRHCERVIFYSMILYLVCVFPTFIMLLKFDIDSLFRDYERYDLNKDVVKWVYLIFYTNSVLNVFVYAGKFKDFRGFLTDCLRYSGKKKAAKQSQITSAHSRVSMSQIL